MDEKTERLRSIFIDATGADTVTERQEESPGSLAEDDRDTDERVRELVGRMRERYDFASGLDDDALVRVVHGYFDGESDADIAAALGADEATVREARFDLHLLRDADRDRSVDLAALRRLVVDGADLATCVDRLDAPARDVREAHRVVATEVESTRANDRFRDEFEALLTDADLTVRLARDAREDGLEEATEDIETNVSL